MGDVAAARDGQAPARRFGTLAAAAVVLCVCACAAAVWALFAQDSLAILQTSLRLASAGETTTGTVVEVEEFEGTRPTSSTSFTLFVEYEVEGKSYTIKGSAFYPVKGSSWIREPMPVIYDPEDPGIAQIDTFNERWLMPLTSVIP